MAARATSGMALVLHGTSRTSALSIVANGYDVTRLPRHGRVLGDGIYLTKSIHNASQYGDALVLMQVDSDIVPMCEVSCTNMIFVPAHLAHHVRPIAAIVSNRRS